MKKIKSSLKARLWLLNFIWLFGCATTPVYQSVKIPIVLSSYFDECERGEGTLELRISGRSGDVESTEFDWSSQPRAWEIAGYSPFGQTVYKIEFDQENSKLTSSGRELKSLFELGLSENGFLIFNGNEIKILAKEIPCLLNMAIPRSWLSEVVEIKENHEKLFIVIMNSERMIRLQMEKKSVLGKAKWLADVSWPKFWGFYSTSVRFSMIDSAELNIESPSNNFFHVNLRKKEDFR